MITGNEAGPTQEDFKRQGRLAAERAIDDIRATIANANRVEDPVLGEEGRRVLVLAMLTLESVKAACQPGAAVAEGVEAVQN